jgi:hypothetical protein
VEKNPTDVYYSAVFLLKSETTPWSYSTPVARSKRNPASS